MVRAIVLFCEACVLIFALGCQGQSTGKGAGMGPASSQQRVAGKSGKVSARIDPRLVGTWMESSFGGHVTFTFRADGTCRTIVHSAAGVIRGVATTEGSCTLSGSVITMHETRESWVPTGAGQQPGFSNRATDRITRLHIRQLDAQTLILVDDELGFEYGLDRVSETEADS